MNIGKESHCLASIAVWLNLNEIDPIEGYCMDNVVNENGSKAIETKIGTQSRGEKVV